MHDLIIVGAGIVGLAHAYAAARRGMDVLVIDRDAQANGASVRNFGFVTVTGQERGKVWRLAQRSAAIWRQIAPDAGIAIEQEGLFLVAQRPEAAAVIEAFSRTEMGEDCTLLSAAEARAHCPQLTGEVSGALLSRADVRVESRTAIPLLARWLEEAHGVRFQRGVAVNSVATGLVRLSDGSFVKGGEIVVCPGDDWASLFPREYTTAGVTRCQLQMLRLTAPGWRLPAPVMTDLSMIRYLGYSALPEAEALRLRLERECAAELGYGIHLIAVQSADGTLVVGDSHVYAATPPPFTSEAIDAAMVGQFSALFGGAPPVIERWTGTYASGPQHSFVRRPMPGVRLAVVTSGTGASTGFALAEDVISQLYE
ncbi:TIGR03364 family FAD-dependent oxidoreductase [Novosphingobium album (ex Hu et al. 2023)]|uniref:TIGR03364 family FAD-dependent oxidoreductase n=1 Tax=Novosphingobium album (ex Hu et al. 2023) TaxID=2930093 RepID=A0ABT0AYS2_9SPHN|nr:TIGR03364 family FAD-dependent oxidoreductase [Novosphingobium album (ex Hu et al. 2023)]MCJ2177823.1 TIGR03364 family FAD-dependent oxidoreductase [Novosphingobium album (ex Hu et al. 2023)]